MSAFGDVGASDPLAIWSGVTGWHVAAEPDGATLVEAFAPARADWATLERIADRRPQPL